MNSTPARGRPFMLVALLICLAGAQSHLVATEPEALRGNVFDVSETRSTTGSMGGCRVTITIVGDDLDDVAAIIRARPTKAIDELDRDLLSTNAATEPLSLPTWRYSSLGRPRTGGLNVTLTLRNPSRRAATIKLIEGTLDLYHPTEANGGIVKIAAAEAKPGTAVKNSTLAKYGIEITYLDEQETSETRSTSTASILDSTEEKRRLDAVADEVARRRAIRELAATSQSETTNLPASRATVTTTAPAGKADRVVRTSLQIKDPNHKLIDALWRDANGAPLRARPSYAGTSSPVRSIFFYDVPSADAELIVFISSDESIRTAPFKVENIVLP